jgi:tetratricopeptide (TPR) repeat protein
MTSPPSRRPVGTPSKCAALALLLATAGCGVPPAPASPVRAAAEAVSLLGEPLHRPALAPETRARLERDLAEARAAHERDPGDADAIIWLGRRLAYLGRYREAVEVFGEGARRHPADARMLRHRGHRHITLRQFDLAVADLERATELVRGRPDEVEPDGAPNRYNIPTSTLHSNIWYHLGLAHYLRGDWERALAAYRECVRVSDNDDMRVATADWLYMTLRRMGRDAEAAEVLRPIRREMRILENHAYHRRLLMYRGELPPDSLLAPDADALQMATQGYGVGNWYLYNGRPERAREVFRAVLSHGNWPAFGHIAAETELRRMGDAQRSSGP